MYYWKNGFRKSIPEKTPGELAMIEAEIRRARLKEASRPMTAEEVFSMMVTQQINSMSVDDNTAIRMKGFYPTFDAVVGKSVTKGFKFTYGGKLWKTEQPEMVIQAHYAPGVGMESLYSEVCETHEGTLDDPIPYNNNMALESGKYYMQNWIIYKCTRDTVNPVYNPLDELVELYVEHI